MNSFKFSFRVYGYKDFFQPRHLYTKDAGEESKHWDEEENQQHQEEDKGEDEEEEVSLERWFGSRPCTNL